MKYHYRNVKATAKVYKPSLSFSILVSLSFKSVMFSCSSKPLFPHFIDLSTLTLHTCDIQNVHKAWIACQSYFIILTVHIHGIRNIYKTWIACQSYFIALTVCICEVRNDDRLLLVWGLLRLTPIRNYKMTRLSNECRRVITPHLKGHSVKYWNL